MDLKQEQLHGSGSSKAARDDKWVKVDGFTDEDDALVGLGAALGAAEHLGDERHRRHVLQVRRHLYNPAASTGRVPAVSFRVRLKPLSAEASLGLVLLREERGERVHVFISGLRFSMEKKTPRIQRLLACWTLDFRRFT